MRMTSETTARCKLLAQEAVGVGYAALAALSAGTLVTGLMGWPLAAVALWFLPACLGYIGGRLSRGKPLRQARLWWGGGMALAMAVSVAGILQSPQPGAIWAVLLMDLLICRWGCSDGDGCMACALTMWVADVVLGWAMEWGEPYTLVASRCTELTCLLTLAVLAVRSARRSTRGGKESAIPPGLRRRVLGLTAVLLAAALVVSILPFLRKLFGSGLGLVLTGITTALSKVDKLSYKLLDLLEQGLKAMWSGFGTFLNWLAVWFLSLPFFSGDSGIAKAGIELPELPWTLLAVLFRLLLLVAVGAVLVALIRSNHGRGKEGRVRRRKPRSEELTDFSQQVRREISLKKLWDRMRETVADRVRRKPRLSDFPDGEGKIRFAFSRWLVHYREENARAAAATPTELLAGTDQAVLADYYDQIRYGARPAPPDAAQVAQQAVDALEALPKADRKK